MSRLGVDIARMLVAQVWFRAADLLLAVAMAHLLPRDDLGRFFLALSAARIGVVLANANAAPLVTRRIARDPTVDGEQLAGLFSLRVRTAVPWLLAATVAAIARPDLGWAGLAVAAHVLVEDVHLGFTAVLMARHRSDLSVAIGVPAQAITLIIATAAAWNGDWSTLGAALVVRSVLLAGVSWWTVGAPRPRWLPGLLSGNLPFFASAIVNVAAEHGDTAILGAFAPYPQLAAFNLAIRTTGGVSFLPNAVLQVMFPTMARRTDDRLVRISMFAMAGAGAAIGGALVVITPIIGHLPFGDHAPVVLAVLPPLLALLPAQFVVSLLTTTATARDAERPLLLVQAVAVGVGVLTALATVPTHGIAGATAGRALTAACQLVGLTMILSRTAQRIS